MSSWTCDGVPKDGKQYPGAFQHSPQENTGPDCTICGLPKEAMQAGKKPAKTVVAGSSSGGGNSSNLVPLIIILIVLGLGGAILAYFLYRPVRTPTPITTSSPSPSPVTATQGEFISRGEEILLESSPSKTSGATAFDQKNWEAAIAGYQAAVKQDPNDPEGRIYFNNAQAQKAGNSLVIAVAVPTTTQRDSAAEILRGVARYQEEYNQSSPPSGRLLEVAIVNISDSNQATALAQEIINTSEILGIIGYGIDPSSQEALKQYETAGLTVLSPLTTSVSQEGGKPTLKTIPIDEKANELLVNYLQGVGKTLTNYASQQQPYPAIVVFYNQASNYSQQLRMEIVNAIPGVQGKLIQQIDISSSDFDAKKSLEEAQQNGAKIAILAFNKDKVNQAVAIAKANQTLASPLLLLGGDELYNADLLVEGGDAISGIILAVPWSFSPTDPFAKDALDSWKGRVSWRTATAYDATIALTNAISQKPDRPSVNQAFTQGVILNGNTTNFDVFNDVPLVKAVKGNEGPKGSDYQFDPLK
ncbi:hydrophobic amino acid uptake ABC-transporter [Rippkaea orientalis PCC 8801]|uniref:Hydrophobic amino acid uptake ABC-transporter n=1 Tax=Rippkaea orientalis (strain PCC 8801 / RF-1) TaxID=41431 RepID=B7JZQ1_RIPO1|nr:ABC transporter substrate-binding protein [Rippkaea orientalis]ACK64994.1 hydrophobic amino acid uptake ABC-transporter [Rippkaea orientalis PCC 8801]